jgi:hypothetical protein
VFVAALVIALLVKIVQSKSAADKARLVRSRRDFCASDVYVSDLDQNGLAIDSSASRLLLVRGDHQHIFSASDIVSVEVLVDDASLLKTNRGSQATGAAFGALLLGPVGLLVGGLTASKRSENRVKRLILRIVISDFAKPNHDILLFKSLSEQGDAKTSLSLREPLRIAETWHSRVTLLIKSGNATPTSSVPSSPVPSLADELRKLDSLRRDGLLTDAEFDKQKQRLLREEP